MVGVDHILGTVQYLIRVSQHTGYTVYRKLSTIRSIVQRQISYRLSDFHFYKAMYTCDFSSRKETSNQPSQRLHNYGRTGGFVEYTFRRLNEHFLKAEFENIYWYHHNAIYPTWYLSVFLASLRIYFYYNISQISTSKVLTTSSHMSILSCNIFSFILCNNVYWSKRSLWYSILF